MSAPRAFRPLSRRYQQLRHASTTPAPNFARRNRGRLVWSATGLTIGVVAGNFINHTIAPPALPDAGTDGDKVLMADLTTRIDEEFKVKVLRGKCLAVGRQLKGKPEGWVELVREATGEGLIPSLAGAKALGVERLFWNREEEKLVAVVWFGGSVSGWPGVTHGGMIATQMVEKVGMVAALMHGEHGLLSRAPGTGQHAKMMLPADLEEPEQLSLSYVKPTYANSFYVVRVAPALPLDTDPANIIPPEPAAGKHDYEATLETMDGTTLVRAKARISASKLERFERKAEHAVQWTSEQLKQWMWPSRQSLMEE